MPTLIGNPSSGVETLNGGQQHNGDWITDSVRPKGDITTPASSRISPITPSHPPHQPMSAPPRGVVPSELLNAQNLTVNTNDAMEGLDGGQNIRSPWRWSGPMIFSGGLISGLRSLPRAVLGKSRGRNVGVAQGAGNALSLCQSANNMQGPSEFDTLYPEASEMSTEHTPPAPSQAHLRLSDSRSSCSCPDRGPSRTRRCMYHANGRSRRASYSIRHDHIHDTPSSVHSFSEHSRFDREGGDHTLMYNLAPDLEMYPGSIDPSSDYAKTESPRRSPSASFF